MNRGRVSSKDGKNDRGRGTGGLVVLILAIVAALVAAGWLIRMWG
jgi:hypothetical protein